MLHATELSYDVSWYKVCTLSPGLGVPNITLKLKLPLDDPRPETGFTFCTYLHRFGHVVNTDAAGR